MSGLSRVAPAPAGIAAGWLFCRTARHRRRMDEARLLQEAQPLPVRLGRRPLRAWRWGTGDDVVLLVHGWSGHGGQLARFAPALVERGLSVVTWDGPGHGSSYGSSSSLVELADACFAVARTLRVEPHGIIGHSMGAAAAAVAIAEGLPVERAAWIAPSASLLHFVEEYAHFMRLGDAASASLVRSMESRFTARLRDFELEEAGVPRGDRMLVLHDELDREVPVEHGERVARALRAEFVRTRGLGHRRILRDPAVIRRVARWIGASRAVLG